MSHQLLQVKDTLFVASFYAQKNIRKKYKKRYPKRKYTTPKEKNMTSKRRRYTLILCTLLTLLATTKAQELNCNLKINTEKIQGTNKSVFTTLQKDATEYLNNRKWTTLNYDQEERIECNINIIINAVQGDTYTAELTVQSRRPVYQSSYYTTLLNFRDVLFTFDYTEFQPLEFDSNNLTSNLISVLTYYAYLIIGYDMDSFSSLGGTPYFQAAENIVNQAQSKNWVGWKAFENSKNRYALISNIMDEAFKKYRQYFYQYHRQGLDMMTANPTNGRAKIADGINTLLEAYNARPKTIVISSFIDAKNDELINLFKNGTTDEKKQVYEVLSTINPSQNNRYEQILKK